MSLVGRALLLAALLLVVAPALQAPLLAQSAITSPTTGGTVSGDVPIMGTAVIDPFQKYELHYKLEPSGDDAYIYFFGATTPVANGQLGIWQAGGLAPGTYSLRLRVVKLDGNYAEFFAQNISVNQGPPTTPTPATPEATPTSSEPTPTPIPTATFTPAPQPTPVVGQVAQPALEVPAPTPTPQVVAVIDSGQLTGTDAGGGGTGANTLAAVTNADTGDTGGSVTRELGEALSLNRLRDQFFNGMRFSAALLFGVVALYAGKRLFDWMWTQFS